MSESQSDNKQMHTPKCRLAFPSLDKPTNFKGKGKLEFQATLIFPDGNCIREMRQEAKRVAVVRFGNNLPPNFWTPFRRCEEKLEKKYKGFEPGGYFIKCKADQAVQLGLFDSTGKIEVPPETFYAGCYVVADIHFYAYEEGINKGVSVRLNGLQWAGHGERFAGRTVSFEDLGIEEGAMVETESDEDFL